MDSARNVATRDDASWTRDNGKGLTTRHRQGDHPADNQQPSEPYKYRAHDDSPGLLSDGAQSTSRQMNESGVGAT